MFQKEFQVKIGLIGKGFVGNAIYENLKSVYDFLIFDKDPSKSNSDNIRVLCHGAKIIFVALPTPMKKDGSCDLSIILHVMAQLSYWANDNIIILKSTVPPGTCRIIKDKHPELRLVFSPEFLTEANHIEDFKNCNRVIMGGDSNDVHECFKMLSDVFPKKQYLRTSLKTSEMVKYFINNFLAVKVIFANEMKQICEASGIDYEDVKDLALHDNRIGQSHLSVPGPDGSMGFGGTCFPKDINAMIFFAKSIGIDPSLLLETWNKNLKIRKNKDWLKMIGRAISEKEQK